MAQPAIQTSFNSGELAPALNARVDLAQYHKAAALLRNFFVDYRGGASTRFGTEYLLQAYKSSTPVRLIPFQASTTVGYVLEFGDFYVRFYTNGSVILEATISVTAITGNQITATTSYAVGDWIFINGNYYAVSANSGTVLTVTDLNGNATTVSGPTTTVVARVYTLSTPFAAADLALLKFTQDVTSLILTHPSYPPQILTITAANNWSINAINFGTTIGTPTGLTLTTTDGVGTPKWWYGYLVTAVDANGQESNPTTPVTINSNNYIGDSGNKFSMNLSWTAVTGATSYNIYKATPSFNTAIPTGAQYGFIQNQTAVSFVDSFPGIGPDFATTPPIAQNPFQGAGIASYTVTAAGTYTTVPSVTIAAPPSGGTATVTAALGVVSAAINSHHTGGIGDVIMRPNVSPAGSALTFINGVVINILTAHFVSTDGVGNFGYNVDTFSIQNSGSVTGTGTSTPSNPKAPSTCTSPNWHGPAGFGNGFNWNFTWGVISITPILPGSGYTSPPVVTFSSGAAAAIAVLAPLNASNPSVCGFYQERLILAALPTQLQSFFMSQPGSFFNFGIHNPIEADDAISGQIISGQLNEIKSLVTVPSGVIALTSKSAWLINGTGTNFGQGSVITPSNASATQQAFNGASDLPPIQINFDVLFNQAKSGFVRDLTYNLYASVYTGTDISVQSSHLFYGFVLNEWCWAEEPLKTLWAVRSDGILLSLAYIKEQELLGWAHSDTQGLFKSICSVVEQGLTGLIDAVYTVVQRTINGNVVQYVERMAERIMPAGVSDAWCVDAGIQYVGTPTTSFAGAQHLAAATVTGLADGVVIPPFTMPASGSFTLGVAASKVTVGLPFVPQLQTQILDLGEPTVQGKRKKITGVTARCQETLGLSIGKTFSSLVPMKDLVIGNVGTMTNKVVAGLVTGDARTIPDPSWDVPGQYCFQQSNPLPATILGVIPEVVVGDTK